MTLTSRSLTSTSKGYIHGGTARRARTGLRAAIAALGVALVATACASANGKSSSAGNLTATGGKRGGTLNVLMQSDFEHLDPQRVYVAVALNADRLLTRTLTTYKAVPGIHGTDAVPDLAQSYSHSPDCTAWTFKLRPGLKFEDGTPIRAADVKYGVERSFSDLITDGPQYAKQYIVGGDTYKGPYQDTSAQGLRGIEVQGDDTLVFHLVKTVCDFNYTAAFPLFSPVEKAKDTKDQLDNHPVSTGPYKVQTYDRDRQLVLVRNPHWDKATDDVRGAYPDKIVFQFGLDASIINQRLISDQGPDETSITLDTNVTPAFLTKVMSDPGVKRRTISGNSPAVWYVAINTARQKNQAVRKALNYATSREQVRAGCGGQVCGTYATGITSPTLPSYNPQENLYHIPPTGDINKARQILQQAGVKTPVKLTMAYPNYDKGVTAFTALQQAWERDGLFQITPQPIPRKSYYSTIGQPQLEPDLVYAGWSADWPSGSTVLPPLFDGRQIVPRGNQNLTQLNNAEIDKAMDQAAAETNFAKQQQMWGHVEDLVLRQDAIIPLRYDQIVQLFGSRVRGAYLHYFYGSFDVASLSVV
jgi:peptide/nickel transport system substrate-binding protein